MNGNTKFSLKDFKGQGVNLVRSALIGTFMGVLPGVGGSAASILAKTARDAELYDLDAKYPQYGFARHKGYPTSYHLKMLSMHGVSEVHRRSYAPVRKILESDCSI